MISTWSRLYKAFARCSALVATAEENTCCEELCVKISASLDREALKVLMIIIIIYYLEYFINCAPNWAVDCVVISPHFGFVLESVYARCNSTHLAHHC